MLGSTSSRFLDSRSLGFCPSSKSTGSVCQNAEGAVNSTGPEGVHDGPGGGGVGQNAYSSSVTAHNCHPAGQVGCCEKVGALFVVT
jgi:hypothetical protein